MRLYDHRDEIRAKSQDSAHLSRSGAPVAQWSIGCWARSRAFSSSPPGLSFTAANIYPSSLQGAWPRPIGGVNRRDPGLVGPGLCRILDTNFGEFIFSRTFVNKVLAASVLAKYAIVI